MTTDKSGFCALNKSTDGGFQGGIACLLGGNALFFGVLLCLDAAGLSGVGLFRLPLSKTRIED